LPLAWFIGITAQLSDITLFCHKTRLLTKFRRYLSKPPLSRALIMPIIQAGFEMNVLNNLLDCVYASSVVTWTEFIATTQAHTS